MDKLDALLVHVPKTNEYYPLIGRQTVTTLMTMGLFSIADAANKSGTRTKILHLGVMTEKLPAFSLPSFVRDSGVQTVGFSLHWHHQTWVVLHEAFELKRRCPNVRIVLGGFTASYFARELIMRAEVDAVCVGEGEKTFADLCRVKPGDDFHGIPNLVWKKDCGVIVNPESHSPSSDELGDFSFFDARNMLRCRDYISWSVNPWIRLHGVRNYIQRKAMLQDEAIFPLMTFRGCLQNCSFCGGSKSSYEILCKRKSLSAQSAKSSFRTAREACAFGFKTLFMETIDSPATNRESILLFEKLAGIGGLEKVVVECRTTPGEDILDAMSALTRAGKEVRIHLSPDRADYSMRKKHKSMATDDESLFQALHRCAQKNISVEVYFIAGMPDQSAEEIRLTQKLRQEMLRVPAVKAVRVQSVLLEPASPMFENPERFGLEKSFHGLNDYLELHRRPHFPFPLGYRPVDSDLSYGEYTARVQRIICDNFCRMDNRMGAGADPVKSLISASASTACRAVVSTRRIRGGR